MELSSTYPITYCRKCSVLVTSVNENPVEKWDKALMSGSIWQCHEVPLPALPCPEPPSLSWVELVMELVEMPWAVSIYAPCEPTHVCDTLLFP